MTHNAKQNINLSWIQMTLEQDEIFIYIREATLCCCGNVASREEGGSESPEVNSGVCRVEKVYQRKLNLMESYFGP